MQQVTKTPSNTSSPLVAQIRSNYNDTLAALYTDNYYKIEKYILNNSGTTAEAKDLYQEAFIAVWRNVQMEKFIPENKNEFAGYLYRVARNKWIDQLRSTQKKLVPLNDADGIETLSVYTMPEEDSNYLASVRMHFKTLGDNCKEVLSRFYYYNQSLKTIAANFNWTEATAKNNKYRCLQKLRQLLKK